MLIVTSFAQVPEKLNYQAVVRNNSGELIANQNIDVQVSIIDSLPDGTDLYRETHSVISNDYGVISIKVGEGIPALGTFNAINWLENDKYLKTEVDLGDGFINIGTSQLLSVPFSFYAQFTDSARVANNAYALRSNGVYSTSSDTLFVVKDHDGNVVFAVFPDGAQVFVNEATKGKVGGFAVSGRSPNKEVDLDILRITADSTRVYVNEELPGKGKVGGFAVSGRSPNKEITNNYLQILPDSTRIYVKDSLAGFGIANIESGTSESLLNLTKQNYLIGHNAGSNLATGRYNSMIGYEAGFQAKSSFSNLFFGHRAGYSNTSGNDNIFIGNKTGFNLTGGYDNIFIGNLAGEKTTGATHSTFIGNEAGKNVNGDDNVCIGDRTGYNQYLTNNEFYATTIIGIDAGRNLVGNENTIIGNAAGFSAGGSSSGNNNVFIGAYAGGGAYTSRLGNNNVCIGYNAGAGATGNDQLFIANNSTTTLIYGDFSAEEVFIDGDLVATTVTPSDINLKTNITSITSGLHLLLSLNGYYFNWNNKAEEEFKFSKEEQQIGVIAQEVEKVLPQMVKTNSKGYKVVEYSKLSPVIIEAIKEQQNQIEELKKENEDLQRRLESLEEMLTK